MVSKCIVAVLVCLVMAAGCGIAVMVQTLPTRDLELRKEVKIVTSCKSPVTPQLYPDPPHNDSVQWSENGVSTFPSQYRLTRLVNPEPKWNAEPVQYPNKAISPRYQCAGKSYRVYMEKALHMIQEREKLDPTSLWGKRSDLAFPTNKQILVLGNSHTRQAMTSLTWQFEEQLQSFELGRNSTVDKTSSMVGKFAGGSFNTTTTIYFGINHAAIYSRRWKQNIEEILLGFPFEDIDAIVMGVFNRYDPKNPIHVNSGLWRGIRAYAEEHPELEIDPADPVTQKGIELAELMKVYGGPIIYLSGFRKDHTKTNQNILELIRNTTDRTNLRMVNSRAPIDAIGGGECGHENKFPPRVSSCYPNLGTKHRCTGNVGGIPDIVAWDAVETLHDLLG